MMRPVDWGMGEAEGWIIFSFLHKVIKVNKHISSYYHVRVETDDVRRTCSFDSSFSSSEETREVLAIDFEEFFFDIANRETTVELWIDVSIRVVTDDDFTVGEAKWTEFFNARVDSDR